MTIPRTLNGQTNILVTGATGLIGGEIVRMLNGLAVKKIWALVRPRPDASAQTRFAERLQRSGESADEAWSSSVEVVPGDVSMPGWNLTPEDETSVRRNADIILHCAADTSFLCQRNVRDVNIEGTRHLIDLARACERKPLIVYMSTATNMGKTSHRCLSEDEGCQPDNEHHNEYTRSKAVAETLLRDSGLPVLTLRPTIVLSAGLPDPVFAQQILWFVPLLRKFNCLPVDPASRLDLVPVSYVAKATVALLQKSDRARDCYYLSAGERDAITTGEVNDFLNKYYQRKTPLHLVLPPAWTKAEYRTHVRTSLQRKFFFGMRYYLPFLNMDVVYDNRCLRQELGPDMPRIAPLTEYMGGLLTQITARRAVEEAARP